MPAFGPYETLIGLSLILILSFGFSLLSRKTNIPSVLLLIILGIALQLLLTTTEITLPPSLQRLLELLGIAGLVMIVLEAALDLKLSREKLPLIGKAGGVALFALAGTTGAIGWLFHYLFAADWHTALLYALPLSVLSSAIIIPSVGSLQADRREFMVYDGTFSDIFGIIAFYFLSTSEPGTTAGAVAVAVGINLGTTLVIALVSSYLLVWLFTNIRMQVKLFLLIAILILLYAVGKKLHLSSLIIILLFGLVFTNYQLFFAGPLRRLVKPVMLDGILHNFHTITLETAFVVRTFFFVVFGLTLSLEQLFDLETFLIGCAVTALIFGVRWLFLRLWAYPHTNPELWIAPRGLITILLFFSIPPTAILEGFNPGILLYAILLTSLIMSVALIRSSGTRKKLPELDVPSLSQVDEEIDRRLKEQA